MFLCSRSIYCRSGQSISLPNHGECPNSRRSWNLIALFPVGERGWWGSCSSKYLKVGEIRSRGPLSHNRWLMWLWNLATHFDMGSDRQRAVKWVLCLLCEAVEMKRECGGVKDSGAVGVIVFVFKLSSSFPCGNGTSIIEEGEPDSWNLCSTRKLFTGAGIPLNLESGWVGMQCARHTHRGKSPNCNPRLSLDWAIK